MSEQSHVDIATLDMLQDVLEGGFAGLLETFIQDSSSKIESLKLACKQADIDTVRRSAHSLKGSSSNLGAMPLADLSLEVERKAREDSLDGVDELIDRIEREYQAVFAIMNDRLSEL